MAGCDDSQRRLTEAYREEAQHLRGQQQQVTQQAAELQSAAADLVRQESDARQAMVEHHSNLQGELQAERKRLDQERQTLDGERRDIAAWRYWEPIVAVVLESGLALLLAGLPVLVCVVLLRTLREDRRDEDLTDLLTIEITSDRPRILDLPVLPPVDPPTNPTQLLDSPDNAA